MTSATIRLRGKKLFLTYPQCPLSKELVLSILQSILGENITGYCIAEETHESGDPHLHCYLELSSPLGQVSATHLDLTSSTGDQYHGNYQCVRSSNAVKKYITKEGTFLTNLDSLQKSTENPWKRAREVASEEGLIAALEILEANPKTARDLCLNGDRIAKNLGALTTKRHKVTYTLESFNWTVSWNGMTHTLLIYGATDTGKTALAKALLPNGLMVRHLDILKAFRPGFHDGIILDDMAFGHLHREAQIALIDRHEDTHVHVRYTVAEIPAGTPVIVTSNRPPSEVFNTNDPAIARRLLIVLCKGVGQYFEQ